jgi:hypothetical protein
VRVQSRLLPDVPHSGDVAKCGIASVVVLGSCVCAGWELCGASEVALKTFEKMQTTVQSEGPCETKQKMKEGLVYRSRGRESLRNPG